MPFFYGNANFFSSFSLGDRYLSYSSLMPKHLSLRLYDYSWSIAAVIAAGPLARVRT